jgi:hypothetical protein
MMMTALRENFLTGVQFGLVKPEHLASYPALAAVAEVGLTLC